MKHLHGFALGRFDHVFRVHHSPAYGQWLPVCLIAYPDEVACLDAATSAVNSGGHAIGSIHQEWNRTVIDFTPFQCGILGQDTAQCGESDGFTFRIFNFHS